MEELILVKIGGSIIEDSGQMTRFLRQFAKIDRKKILVHGGGRSATALANQLGVEVQMVEGRRVTDAEMLRIVIMVYGGLVNKTLVSQLQACGCDALGLTGADANIIKAHRRENEKIDYGFVGDIDAVNARSVSQILEENFTPVLAPLTHDGQGNLLNTNADTIAARVAIALATRYNVRLLYCFEKPGVLEDVRNEQSVIPILSRERYRELKTARRVASGMLPKLDNGYLALEQGVRSVSISHADNLDQIMNTNTQRQGTRLIL